MSSTRIVCPFDPDLLARLQGRELFVRTSDPTAVQAIPEAVRQSGNALACVLLDLDVPLASLALRDEWKGIPLALMAPELGRFRSLAPRVRPLKELGARVYLPATGSNLTGARQLSSVGIPSGLLLDAGPTDWESLTELATYALLERTPHAPIDPFAYLAAHYEPESYTRWGPAGFDDPERFLHMDAAGRVALSRRELLDGAFVGTLSEAESAQGVAQRTARASAWKRLFLDDPLCSSCPGLRVCGGRVPRDSHDPPACAGFFGELMDLIESRLAREAAAREDAPWQR